MGSTKDHSLEPLPDEDTDAPLHFAPGMLDGIFGGSDDATRHASRIHRALAKELTRATRATLADLYKLLTRVTTVDYIDQLLAAVDTDPALDRERLHDLATWLATSAPHRNPVKLALAVLGHFAREGDREILLHLGRHDEFTLFATVGLLKLGGGERQLFELAKNVDGWGRIQIVERLADTTDPEIKAWMLREGYKNSIMYEYLAYTCAESGGLQTELERDTVDPALLAGAGDLLEALIHGGPARGIEQYAAGARVAELYLRHLGPSPTSLKQLLVVDALLGFLDRESERGERRARGWTTAHRLRQQCLAVKNQDHWAARIQEGLASTDDLTFSEATRASKALAIDTWDEHFARLQTGRSDWQFVMQTDDPHRVDRVLALAAKQIPLEKIATGPGSELGIGPRWAHHLDLDLVVQELERFPGKGWPLIAAALRSPVVRNRNMAVRALAPWGKGRWPTEARAVLTDALAREPDDHVRAGLRALLAGE